MVPIMMEGSSMMNEITSIHLTFFSSCNVFAQLYGLLIWI